MKTLKTILPILAILLLNLTNIFATETTVPGNQLNALAEAVAAASPGDVLLLEAGKVYPNEGKLTIDKELTIKATGTFTTHLEKPKVVQVPNASGERSGQTIEPHANVTFINIYFDGQRSEDGSDYWTIRTEEPNISLTIDGCVFSRSGVAAIRLNKATDYVSITNTIFASLVAPGSVSEGRGLDLREGPHKYVLLQNNTFSNSNDRWIRHIKWGQNKSPVVDTLIVDHNTFNQGLGYRPAFQFSAVGYLEFTNNLVINPNMLGTDTLTNRVNEINWMDPEAVANVGPNAITVFNIVQAAASTESGFEKEATKIYMKHNNVYLEQAVKDLYATTDRIEESPLFNNEMATALGSDLDAATYSELLTFGKVGDLHLDVVTNFISMVDTITVIGNETNPGRPASGDRFFLEFGVDTLDLSYNTDARSYTEAAGGFPVGDLNWFPTKKQEWIDGGMVGVESNVSELPEKYSLSQNYPNPFNPTTVINFSIPESGLVSVKVYNALGQQVAELVNEVKAAGSYDVDFNASNLSSGMYIYKISAGQFSATRKMMLLK